MKLTLEQKYIFSVLLSQYHACWCAGYFRSIDPKSYDILSPVLEELMFKECYFHFVSWVIMGLFFSPCPLTTFMMLSYYYYLHRVCLSCLLFLYVPGGIHLSHPGYGAHWGMIKMADTWQATFSFAYSREKCMHFGSSFNKVCSYEPKSSLVQVMACCPSGIKLWP